MDLTLIIIVAVVVVLIIIVIGIYNGLIQKRLRIDEALAQIEVQLKRRHDLIPNLVNAVKGYMGFEQKVLTDVTNARAAAVTAGAQGPAQQAAAENMLTSTLRSLFAVVENYLLNCFFEMTMVVCECLSLLQIKAIQFLWQFIDSYSLIIFQTMF